MSECERKKSRPRLHITIIGFDQCGLIISHRTVCLIILKLIQHPWDTGECISTSFFCAAIRHPIHKWYIASCSFGRCPRHRQSCHNIDIISLLILQGNLVNILFSNNITVTVLHPIFKQKPLLYMLRVIEILFHLHSTFNARTRYVQ